MSRSKLRNRIWGWSALLITYGAGYALAELFPDLFPALCGESLKICQGKWQEVANTFKALVPMVIVIPVASLSAAFNSHISYLQASRDLWQRLVLAVQAAIQYTHLNKPGQRQYATTLATLSVEIDVFRGLFSNVSIQDNSIGLYPYENLKSIHDEISDLDWGINFAKNKSAQSARDEIIKLWKELRWAVTKEFEADAPSYPLLIGRRIKERRPDVWANPTR